MSRSICPIPGCRQQSSWYYQNSLCSDCYEYLYLRLPNKHSMRYYRIETLVYRVIAMALLAVVLVLIAT
jgi:hypothetical protein